MKVLLDTSFVISCVRKKIDFLSQLEEQGFEVVLPVEILQELKGVRENPKESRMDRDAVNVALEMFEKSKIKKMSLGRRMNEERVDDALIRKGNEGYYIATLDNEIKRAVPQKIIIFNAKKSVGVE